MFAKPKTGWDSLALRRRAVLGLFVVVLASGFGIAGQEDAPADASWEGDLADIDLEGLMAIPVTSVAGVARPLRDTPAAIYVITQEDIRRGGHRTLADALRMVPGLNVAQISSSIWAISARGFNGRFSTKLLVLIDGRAVYNTLFSGVFWDVQDTVLADVERIEVIRGPGATLWGANAVNGVINIVTRKARRTQGFYATAGGGTEERAFGTVRYGGKLGEDRFYRVYAKYDDRDSFRFATGEDAGDEWDVLRGGFRVDLESNPDTTVTLQGDIYDGNVGSPVRVAPIFARSLFNTTVRGGNLIARLERLESPDAGWSVQAYYDRAERRTPGLFADDRTTLDVEYRHHLMAGDSHALIWGVGYRYRRDETAGSFAFAFDPPDGDERKYSVFLQDTIRLVDERLSLMVGSKFEHNDFTGFEVQPGVRLAWTPDDHQTAWASFARAVRTPSRGSNDLSLALPAPPPDRLVGNPNLDAEELYAFEVGYRCRPANQVTFDVAGFYNDYDQLISIGAPAPPNVTFSNGTKGKSHGVELTTRWDAADRARIAAAYSYLEVRLDGLDESDEDTSPRHQFNVRSYLDITEAVELNAAAYFVDEVLAGEVPSYVRLDVGVTWRPNSHVELALWGQNLLEESHQEFIDRIFVFDPIEVERGVYARVSVRF